MKSTPWINVALALGTLALASCKPADRTAEAAATPPRAPAGRTLDAGRQFSMSMMDTITSRTAKPGDAFRATVVTDVTDDAGRVAIPAGSVVSGTITDVKSAPNPSSPGTLTLAVNGVTVRGRHYPLDASIEGGLATELSGRAVSGGDVLRVGVGAAAGAIVGQVIGKNTKGTVIGAVVGAAAGAGYAAATKDSDIRLPAGTHVLVTLTRGLTVSTD
ncbi:MAG TPA: glycine zipper domain-containing protein [Gemmatimonadales bacterium]|nr:glycine zipper domain-containing protein [Gemmatimonadales bacterium]